MTVIYLIGYLWFVPAWELAGYLVRTVYRTRARKTGPAASLDFTKDDIWFSRLFHYGMDGARLKFTPEGSGRTISLRKYETDDLEYHVVLELPISGMDESDIATLREYCAAHELPFEDPPENAGETIRVNCGDDALKAYELALETWTKIFRSATKRSYRREVSGIHIDNPGIGPRTWPFIFTRIALAVAVLVSIGAPPDWTAPLGRATLSGSTASLALFVAYFLLVPLSAFRRSGPYLITSTILSFLNLGRVLIGFTLPIAVLLVWAGAAG